LLKLRNQRDRANAKADSTERENTLDEQTATHRSKPSDSEANSEHPLPETTTPPAVGTKKSWVFAAALSTSFMAAIEATIVATAMPTIIGSLGGFELFSWVFSGYLLTQAITIPIYGRLADIHGRKRILYFGIALFLLGSVLCGFAWDMASLIAFRIVQAVGGGALIPVAQTLVGDLYSGEQRARMQGYVSTTFGSAAVLGPTIGSFLVTHVGWPMVFWFNVPLGLVAAGMLAVTFKEQIKRRSHRIDYIGAILMVLSTAAVMIALAQAAVLTSISIVALIVVSALLLLLLLIYERQVPEPMLPLGLFRHPIVLGGNVVGLANGSIMMGIVAFLPSYMQVVMGTSALIGGLALTAMSAAWPVGGFVGSRIMLRYSYRASATSGGLILVLGSVLMTALEPRLGLAWPMAAALLVGLGLGVTNICFVIAIQANVDWNQRGMATSSTAFARIVGQALGTAVFAGIVNLGLTGHVGGTNDVVATMMQPVLHQTTDATMINAAKGAFAQSLRSVYLINGLLSLIVLAAVRFLPSNLKAAE
jgi:EmrB/QacA subfamily drug resistance transporter